MKAFFKFDAREMLEVSCPYQLLCPRGVPYFHWTEGRFPCEPVWTRDKEEIHCRQELERDKNTNCQKMKSYGAVFPALVYFQNTSFYVPTCTHTSLILLIEIVTQNMSSYEGWNFNSGNYLFTTDTK